MYLDDGLIIIPSFGSGSLLIQLYPNVIPLILINDIFNIKKKSGTVFFMSESLLKSPRKFYVEWAR